MTSPPRTIRSRSLHASIRDVSGATVAKALAGNTRSIVEAGKDVNNGVAILRDKLILEYTLRASQLQNEITSLKRGGPGFTAAVYNLFKVAASDVFAVTAPACESVKSLNGKDLTILITYCNLVGLNILTDHFRETLISDEDDIILPPVHEVYLDYCSKSKAFEMDSESMKKLARIAAAVSIEAAGPFYTEEEEERRKRFPNSLLYRAARKFAAPSTAGLKKTSKRHSDIAAPVPKSPQPVPPTEPTVRRSPRIASGRDRSESDVEPSESPLRRPQQVSVSPIRSLPSSPPPLPRAPSPQKEHKNQTLREVMKAMKEAAATRTPSPAGALAAKSTPPSAGSPQQVSKDERDQKLADFANLVAYIHEPFDPSTDEAIKQARRLKNILKAELEEVDRQMSAGEFFTQV